MRIAMLGHKRMPSREGGVEVVVEELSTRMAALHHDVTVYSRKGHNVAGKEFDQQDIAEYKGVRIQQVSTLDVKGLAAVTSSFFATIAAIKDKPDVIHFHAEGPCLMLLMAKLKGIRTVATIHGLDWQRAKWGRFASWYIKLGEKIAAKYADEIIVLSKNIQNYFENEYSRTTKLIPNGVNCKSLKPAQLIKDKYNLDKDDYILFLGRIVPEKGVQYLIEAFKKIDTNKSLVIAGGSSDSNEFYKQMKSLASSGDRIVFTGFVQGAELDELYSNAYVYVLPSDLEGMPLSLLEAMSFKRCCLTSDISECTEVLENAGVVFVAGDVSNLKNKLEELLLNPNRTINLGSQAYELVRQKYNWDRVVEETLGLYKG